MDNRGPELATVTWVFTTISISVVALRIFTRVKIARAAGLDDWLMVLGSFLNVLYSIMLAVCVGSGTGKHLPYLEKTQPQKLETTLLDITVVQVFAVHSFTVTKLSVAYLLIRLFAPRPLTRMILIGFPSLLICVSIATTFVIFWQCTPIRGQWTPALIPVTKCWTPQIYIGTGYTLGALSAVIDVGFGVYPLIVLAKLKMDLRKRLGLACLFGLGLVAAAFAIYKTTFLQSLANHSDVTYQVVPLLMWTSVESNIVIIAACMPTLIPLFRLAYDRRPGTSNKRESKHYQDLEEGSKKKVLSSGFSKGKSSKKSGSSKNDISLLTFERHDPRDGYDSHAPSMPSSENIGVMEGPRKSLSDNKAAQDDVIITKTMQVSQQQYKSEAGEEGFGDTVPDNLRRSYPSARTSTVPGASRR